MFKTCALKISLTANRIIRRVGMPSFVEIIPMSYLTVKNLIEIKFLNGHRKDRLVIGKMREIKTTEVLC